MGDAEKTSVEENIIKRFSYIKDLCDSGISLFTKAEKPVEIDIGDAAFEVTEKIQEEIEEIRDLIFEGENS